MYTIILCTCMLCLLRNIVEQLSDQLRGVRNAHNSGQGSIEEERYHQMQSECQLLQGTCMSLLVCMCVRMFMCVRMCACMCKTQSPCLTLFDELSVKQWKLASASNTEYRRARNFPR